MSELVKAKETDGHEFEYNGWTVERHEFSDQTKWCVMSSERSMAIVWEGDTIQQAKEWIDKKNKWDRQRADVADGLYGWDEHKNECKQGDTAIKWEGSKPGHYYEDGECQECGRVFQREEQHRRS